MINQKTKEIFSAPEVKKWLGAPLLRSMEEPDQRPINLTIEKFKDCSKIIILNCIDNYYGHSLLKLFNAERHLDIDSEYGLIVIVQKNFRWLVPDGIAEIWTVDIPLSQADRYFPSLNDQISNECKRFTTILISRAHSHPSISNITRFSRVLPHKQDQKDYRVSFIWRSDRPWIDNIYVLEAAKRLGIMDFFLRVQNRKVISLFSLLRSKLPNIRFTVIGLGSKTRFPSWIEDHRVDTISNSSERAFCEVYAQSRVVIGVHGSNMLLPSAHAGMTVDLMPKDRWSNFAQDIVYQEPDTRLGSFRYRFFPIATSIHTLVQVITSQIQEYDFYKLQMKQ